jgi:ABC-type branched-subunit amino acid transport system ATPase component/ABC-type branched-subunit amino acid transport system permease subunit
MSARRSAVLKLLVAIAPIVVLGAPKQVLFIGLVDGLAYGLLALGIVLVYRTTRVINLAVGNMGTLAASLLALVVINFHWGFWPAVVLGIVAGAAFATLVEITVVTRLFRAPRVILLVATIGIAQLAQLLQVALPDLDVELGQRFPVAMSGSWVVGGVEITGAEASVLVAVPLITVLLSVLARSRLGKAIQAAADNPDKARLSGISPKVISTVVWGLAGALSALSTTLLAGTSGSLVGLETMGPATLVRVLAAALAGAMVSFPMALVGGVAIGVLQALIRYNFAANAGLVDAVLFLAVLAAVWASGRRDTGEVRESFSFAPRSRPIPHHLRELWWVRHGRLLFGGTTLAIAAAIPFVLGEASRQFLWTRMVILAIIALSLVVLTGWGGQVSLGQGAFAGIGALGTAALVRGGPLGIGVGHYDVVVDLPATNFLVAVAIMSLATALIAVVIGSGALRVRGLLLAVVTLSFALAAQQYAWRTNFFSGGRTTSVSLPRATIPIDLTEQRAYYYLALVVLALAVVVVGRLRSSGIGRSIIGGRDNAASAAAFTVSPTKAKLVSFGLAGGLAGLGGSLLGGLFVTISLTEAFVVRDSIQVLAIAVVGGVGSVAGAIVGSLYIVGIPALWPDNELVPLLSSSFGLLILLMYVPGGLAQIGFAIRDATLRVIERRMPPVVREPDRTRIPATVAAARPDAASASDVAALAVHAVSVRYGDRLAVDGVSLRAAPGEIVGLIGMNGAGKTTLMNAVGGFVPSTGRVELFGVDLARKTPTQRARRGLGRTFQSARLFPDLSVRETVLLGLEARGATRLVTAALPWPSALRRERDRGRTANEIIAFFGLDRYADELVGNLSTGTRHVLELAGLIAVDARLLCLDEPTAGLAQRETEALAPLLRRIQGELGATVLVIEHDMPFIMSISDRVYCLDGGRVLAHGTADQVSSDPAVITSYFGSRERTVLA